MMRFTVINYGREMLLVSWVSTAGLFRAFYVMCTGMTPSALPLPASSGHSTVFLLKYLQDPAFQGVHLGNDTYLTQNLVSAGLVPRNVDPRGGGAQCMEM